MVGCSAVTLIAGVVVGGDAVNKDLSRTDGWRAAVLCRVRESDRSSEQLRAHERVVQQW